MSSGPDIDRRSVHGYKGWIQAKGEEISHDLNRYERGARQSRRHNRGEKQGERTRWEKR